MTTEKKRYYPSFYLTVNSLFLLLILGVGGVLTWHNYRATKKIVLAGAEDTYKQASREVAADFVKTYKPVFQTVTLLSLYGITGADTLEERLSSLEVLCTALRSQSEMTALQVGYGNGDYFIVRALRSDRTRELFQAPDGAAFVVDNIAADEGGGKRSLVRLFFDDRLGEILRHAPEESDYDPRVRPWYRQALESDTALATLPYFFFFLREVGTTISYRPPGTEAVLGADVTLGQLSETVGRHVITPRSEVVLLDARGSVWAYQDPSKGVIELDEGQFRMADLSELGSGVLSFIDGNVKLEPGPLEFWHGGEPWQGFIRPITVSDKGERGVFFLMVSPRRELLADAIRMFKQSLLATLAIILLAIPVAFLIAAVISRALHRLASEADAISRFDFSRPITVRSRIREVADLANSMDLMKSTISRFLSLIKSLAGEQNFDAMLELITEEIVKVSEADGALTWLFNEETNTLDPGALFKQGRDHIDVKELAGLSLDAEHELFKAVQGRELRDLRLLREGEPGLEALFGVFEADALLATAIPLLNRQEEIIGLLCLLNRAAGEVSEGRKMDERIDFVKTFSGFAAVSLESRQLLEMQKRLMDSFMHLLAGAIDAKSPYTGGHCQRVPIITKMIAKAACEDNGLYKDYHLDDDDWEAIHIASWLHDCGKVTTPEYVVDKATKLETISDRIHELRTRFEVLKRDAEIGFWEKVAAGGDKSALRADLEREWQGLDDDFTFVAGCNLGDDPMTPERVERLEEIAGRTWKRTLDDRLGISWEEENRKAGTPKPELPVEEPLIADRPDHLIARTKRERIKPDNPWGFKLDVPEHMYNRGELYNLKVGRGTLNDEERFKINDHIVQTIVMLSKLPYPKHLRKTPEIAGGHHEMINGKGYPKRLTGDEMSITAKMMAIADIFEAITASDRPYKKAKKLSDTIRIMNFMKKDGHLDPDLFTLFLRSGVHLEYARKYLHSDQVDEVDIDAYLS